MRRQNDRRSLLVRRHVGERGSIPTGLPWSFFGADCAIMQMTASVINEASEDKVLSPS